jgi:UDP-N-acetylmuramoyl-L-alanyl-D-glutamate--2,6-diaminopimelate ligase
MAAARALSTRSGETVHAWDGLGRPSEQAAAQTLAGLGISTTRGDGIALLDAPVSPRTLVKSPGLRFDTPLIADAARRNLTVIDEAELGWHLDPRPLIAVTGTNGKSTTTSLVARILQDAGQKPITAGNTRFGIPLSETHHNSGDVVVAELSSFQLEGCSALAPAAAVLTNITHDHRYRHGSHAAYAACKRRAFITASDRVVPVAAVGVDQPEGRALTEELGERGTVVITFGTSAGAARRVLDVTTDADGDGVVTLTEGATTRTLHTRLNGAHNALNIAAALALADALSIDPDIAATAAEATAPLPGRFERVTAAGAPFDVVVDYAHNPDGIGHALAAGRTLLAARGGAGRLHVVVSALSIVDPDQARAMGAAARAGADHLVLTTQRWRLEDPRDTLTPGLLEGARSAGGDGALMIEIDRRAAIEQALHAATPGDLVLILERGEAAGPLFGPDDTSRPFDDRAEARAALAAMRS